MTQHHDPVHPDSPHLPLDILADLAADLLDDDSAAHARHHLDHCAECAARRADFDTLGRELAALPDPALPPEVAARIDSALAGTVGPATSVVPLAAERAARRPDSRSRWAGRALGAAASVAGLLVVSGVVVSAMTTGSGQDDLAASRDAAEVEPVAAGAPVLARSEEYTATSLPDQVDLLLADSRAATAQLSEGAPEATPTAAPGDSAGEPGDLVPGDPVPLAQDDATLPALAPFVRDQAAYRSCVDELAQRPDISPLAVDVGRYDGLPAAIFVLPHADEPGLVEVLVVGLDCGAGQLQLLYYRGDLPRP